MVLSIIYSRDPIGAAEVLATQLGDHTSQRGPSVVEHGAGAKMHQYTRTMEIPWFGNATPQMLCL